MSQITEIAIKLGIPLGDIDGDKYREQIVTSDLMIKTMAEISQATGHETMLLGGLITVPELLGYRQMRRPSNDLDCITTESGVELLYDAFWGKHEMFISRQYSDLFVDYNGLPLSFVIEETHQWSIPSDLWLSNIKVDTKYGNINVISPEYLIMLKTRRTYFANRVYGKDKIDIANLLVAGRLREDREDVDLDKVARLMRRHVTIDKNTILSCIGPMGENVRALNKRELPIFEERYAALKQAVDRVYQ